ncbi:cache domain-containing protein [Burkholderiaceae bacterium DAT-1]|nr:cache domain-containing protein [Burkholderiaceae bacterium DAT-1]
MVSVQVMAEDRGTKQEAEAMVKKAVAYLKQHGAAKAISEITTPSQTFVSKDIYVVAYDTTGKCVAHGLNDKLVGKDLIGLKDPDGTFFVKERVEMAKTKDNFWQEYKFTDPLTKKIHPKTAFCEKTGDLIVCAGVYK